jgi:hypothetical protein
MLDLAQRSPEMGEPLRGAHGSSSGMKTMMPLIETQR